MSRDSEETSDAHHEVQIAYKLLDAPDRRAEGIEKLRNYGDEQVRTRVRAMLEDPDELVRVESIEYLEYWKDEKSIPLLLRSLLVEEGLVVRYAACALARMGIQDALPIVENILELHECDEDKNS